MTLSVRVSEETEKRLIELSKKAEMPRSKIIREAIDAYIEDLEDYYDAVKVLDGIKRGEIKTKPAHEVFKELGLE